MSPEPVTKNAMAFIDGQNLYRHAKAAFGHHHPNFHPMKLHDAVCRANGWRPNLVRFYTGVPGHAESPLWHGYWANRIRAMKRAGIVVTTRPLRYRQQTIRDSRGQEQDVSTPQEKGIDVRLALDVVRLARKRQYDVAVIYSQDQDLAEVVDEVKEIAKEQDRWIKLVCAFPSGPRATARRGINGTDWFRMDEAFYNACLDPRDYRPRLP